MTDEVIQIGVVGAGNTTVTRHIPRFQSTDGVKVVGVVNRTPESSERVARQFGIPKVYKNWTDLMDDPIIDAVLIGTWPYMHSTLVVEALEHDKHVFHPQYLLPKQFFLHLVYQQYEEILRLLCLLFCI